MRLEKPIIYFDIESTGVDTEKDRKKNYADLNKLPKVTDYDPKYLKIETENSERSESKRR